MEMPKIPKFSEQFEKFTPQTQLFLKIASTYESLFDESYPINRDDLSEHFVDDQSMAQEELDDAFSSAIRLNWMKEDKNNKGNYKIPDDKKAFLKREFAKDE